MILFIILFFVSCAVKCDNNYYVIQMPEDPPNNRVPLNDPPFQVYWNVPTMQCTSKKILFEDLYKKFGIIQNQGDSFRGDRIAILYDPGIFPAIFKNETSGKLRFRNGGVPQEGDLGKHLEEFRDIMNQSVPDKDFDGIGIIDFESWRPIYRQNFGVLSPYKDVSYDIVRSNHWWWPQGMVLAEAKRRFEESARTFMESSLIAAKQLRPLAKWGYYAFPYCFNSKTERCADKVTSENDHISWLWSESTALYPSVYSSKNLSSYQLSQHVKGRVDEAARARRGRVKGDVPILPYFWFRYRDGGYMRGEDLQTVLKTFDNSDANGFIIWGSSDDVNTVDKCVKLLNYVNNVLGPAVAKYTKPKRNIDGVGEDIFNSTGTDYSVASEIYDIVTENNSKNNKTEVFSNVTDVNNNNHSENGTKVHLNGSVDTKIENLDVSNDTVKLNENKTNNSETIKLLNMKESEQNDKTQNKSSFSVYSAVDSTLIDKIAEIMLTTEIPEKTTTEKANKIGVDKLEEYHWDAPENNTEDIVKYVKEGFTKNLGPNISTISSTRFEQSSSNNKSHNEHTISFSEESADTKANIGTLYNFIFQKLLEYKNKAESHSPFKEVENQEKKPGVNKTVIVDNNSTKVNISLENSPADNNQELKEKHHDCENCMDKIKEKMKEKKKGCAMMMNYNMEKGHDNAEKGYDNNETKDNEHQHNEENSHVHDDMNLKHDRHKELDDIVENNANSYIDLNTKSKSDEKDTTEKTLMDEFHDESEYTTKQTTVVSDYLHSESDESKINEEEIKFINEMMFPLEYSKKTTTDNYLEVNITEFEIENVKNRADKRNNSNEIRKKIKEITVATEKTVDLLQDIFDNTDILSEITENTTTEVTMTEGTETENTTAESTATESTTTESTTKESTVTEGGTTVSSTTNVEEIFIENISTPRNLITTNKEITTETTTKINNKDLINLIKPKFNITNDIQKNMTKSEKKGRARNINSFTITQPVKTIINEEIRSKENNLKNVKKGLPKSKHEYENLMINQAEKTVRNEEITKESYLKNMKKGMPIPKLKDEYENMMKDELPVSEELVSSAFITEKVTGSAMIAASTSAVYYLCFLGLFIFRV